MAREAFAKGYQKVSLSSESQDELVRAAAAPARASATVPAARSAAEDDNGEREEVVAADEVSHDGEEVGDLGSEATLRQAPVGG